MLVLAFTAQLTVPVGDAQVIVHQAVAHVTVPEHRVEEGLRRKRERKKKKKILLNCGLKQRVCVV